MPCSRARTEDPKSASATPRCGASLQRVRSSYEQDNLLLLSVHPFGELLSGLFADYSFDCVAHKQPENAATKGRRVRIWPGAEIVAANNREPRARMATTNLTSAGPPAGDVPLSEQNGGFRPVPEVRHPFFRTDEMTGVGPSRHPSKVSFQTIAGFGCFHGRASFQKASTGVVSSPGLRACPNAQRQVSDPQRWLLFG